MTEKFETWIARRPDGLELSVCLDPTSEYDRCCRHLNDILVHRYASGSACVVWAVEPGLVHIRRTVGARRLELAQVFFADDDNDVRAALAYVHGVQGDAERSPVLLEVAPGPIVVSWAPNGFGDLDGELPEQHMTTKDPAGSSTWPRIRAVLSCV